MTATLLDGELLATKIRAEVTDRVARLRAAGVKVGLGTILVGDDGPSARYVAMKHADCAEVGIHSATSTYPRTVSQAELEAVVARFNADPAIHAYLVQLPLPAGLDEETGAAGGRSRQGRRRLHPVNLGRLVMGAAGPLPCTPAGIVELLQANDVPVEGKHVVIIGRGLTIGRPLALLLAMKRPGCNAAVTVVHTGVDDLAALVRQGDVVVAAAGRAGLVTPDNGQARRRGGRGRHLMGGQEVAVRCGRGGGGGGRVDHPAARRGGTDDPGDAAAQRGSGRRAGVMSGPAGPESDQRPWGSYTVLGDDGIHKVKRIVVFPGKRLSYQRHARRSEHWFMVRGTAWSPWTGCRPRSPPAARWTSRSGPTTGSRTPPKPRSSSSRSNTGSTSGRTTSCDSMTTSGGIDRGGGALMAQRFLMRRES